MATSLRISSEWHVVATLAGDFVVPVSDLAPFHGATGAQVSRAQCSGCVTDFVRRDDWLGNGWRSASWLSYRFGNLENAAEYLILELKVFDYLLLLLAYGLTEYSEDHLKRLEKK